MKTNKLFKKIVLYGIIIFSANVHSEYLIKFGNNSNVKIPKMNYIEGCFFDDSSSNKLYVYSHRTCTATCKDETTYYYKNEKIGFFYSNENIVLLPVNNIEHEVSKGTREYYNKYYLSNGYIINQRHEICLSNPS